MHVLFMAALDGISAELKSCPSHAWLPAAQEAWDAAIKGGKRRKKAGEVAFPPVATERAVRTALVEGLPVGDHNDVSSPLDAFPVWAWATPDGVEVGMSTLSPAVRRRLAETDEPVTLAHADGGWRTPLSVFRFRDGLEDVRITARTKLPWEAFTTLRELVLDAIADRRQPLLARMAEIGGLIADLSSQRALPATPPTLNGRLFLAWRGFLEARVADADSGALASFAAAAAPLFSDDLPLDAGALAQLEEALAGDWREDLRSWVVPAERAVSEAMESYLGARLFHVPLDRHLTIVRGYVEFFEGFAMGLRYAAAFGAIQGAPLTALQMVAALALGEHAVAAQGLALPAFALPRASHDRGPHMADLDMTLESIC
ncbi:MAG: hypothetical protein KC502_13790 [Myxococcales bacterium]|nr:hypothetical protein [Myxococcales bacterium]